MAAMVLEFVIARNPDGSSSLPYLLRLPLGGTGIALKVRDTLPRTSKVYCHRADGWPDDLEIVERVPVRSCVRRGAAIDLVLDRSREHRSQFVFTTARGREVIFWQSARTAKQSRPGARALRLEVRSTAGHDRAAGPACGRLRRHRREPDHRCGRAQEPARPRRNADLGQAPLRARRSRGSAASRRGR